MTDNVKYTITAEDRFSRVFQALKRDIGGTRDVMSNLLGVAGRVAGVVSLGTAAGLGGAALAVKRLADDIDRLNDVADATGDSIENISALDSFARRSGSSIDVVVKAVEQLNQQLRTAKEDSPVARALRSIGLEARALQGQSATEQLQTISRALAAAADGTAKIRVQQTLFGSNLREIAPLLKDLAEAGELNATVTTKQAEEAERFNKTLSRMSAELNDAGRSMVSNYLPAINDLFQKMRAAQQEFGGASFWERLGILASGEASPFRDAGDGVAVYSKRVAELTANLERLRKGGSVFDSINADRFEAELADAQRKLAYFRSVYQSTAPDLGQSDPRELARRGRGPAALPTPDFKPASTAATTTEAQRLLETLSKQADQYDQLSVSAKLAYDIQRAGIKGLTPEIERQLHAQAARVDALSASATTDPLEQWKEAFIRSEKAAYDEIDEFLKEAASRLSEGSAITDPQNEQKVAFLRSEKAAYEQVAQSIKDAADKGEADFQRLLDAAENFADGTVEAMLDLAEGADASAVFKAFRRDLLREFIQDPVRDVMRDVVKTIRTELSSLDGENNPIAKLFEFLKGIGSSPGGGLGGLFGSLFSGFTGRAGGGGVNRGDLVRWQENGREWFIPQENGSVVTERQLRNAQGGGGLVYSPTLHVNGDVSAQTVGLVRRMLEADRAKLLRQLRQARAV